MKINALKSWDIFFEIEKNASYFKQLEETLDKEYETKQILPNKDAIFNAFNYFDPSATKVVILGQDPYPTEGHAHGLAFSVNKEISPLPKSLKSIFNALLKEYPDFTFTHGNLSHWTKQGVLLLNTVLTIEEGKPLSHQKIGWEKFTQNCMQFLNSTQHSIVYLLWGKNAHKYAVHIDETKNLIVKTSHPSPLGYLKSGKDFIAFKDSGQFNDANQYLIKKHKSPILWY